MLITATITFFILMLSLVAAVAYRMWDREGLLAQSGEAAQPNPPLAGEPSRRVASDPLDRLIDIGRAMPASDESRSATRRSLISAGFRDESAVSIYYGAKAVSLVLFPILCLVLLFSVNPDIFALLPALAGSVYVAMRIPEWYVQRRLTKRKQQVNAGLPDFLDLLVISVESVFRWNRLWCRRLTTSSRLILSSTMRFPFFRVRFKPVPLGPTPCATSLSEPASLRCAGLPPCSFRLTASEPAFRRSFAPRPATCVSDAARGPRSWPTKSALNSSFRSFSLSCLRCFS